MTTDEKLAAILAAVQTDPGNRGLARDPHDNLFTATRGDFERACRSISEHPDPDICTITGFFIPTATPPTFETDGPLGVVFLRRALLHLKIEVTFGYVGEELVRSMNSVLSHKQLQSAVNAKVIPTHLISLEHCGPANDGHCYSMRGLDITQHTLSGRVWWDIFHKSSITIGIGDGGNEIGMGKIPHETIVKNIPNGDKIHCRVSTDHLIVAGVSNWGAYALAAGIFVLKGITPPPDLFDPNREREILEVMVREGPLVDGVTGRQEATVDGLSWEEYSRPLVEIRKILES